MKALPEIDEQDLLVWDDARGKCCGYLNKKASQSSAFSKGKWQKRWFMIETNIDHSENYKLLYFHGPDEKMPRQSFPLASSTLKIVNDTTFILMMSDDSSVSLNADSSEILKLWIQTLEKVISVANMREKMIEHYDRMSESGSEPTHRPAGRSTRRQAAADEENDSQGSNEKAAQEMGQLVQRTDGGLFPVLRIDLDIHSIPPCSAERHTFLSQFAADLSHALQVPAEAVQTLSLKIAPGKEWLTLVEFSLNVGRSETKNSLLLSLADMLTEPSSPLFMGYVTSRVDPTYSAQLLRVVHAHQMSFSQDSEGELYSSDPQVLQILHKYGNIAVEDAEERDPPLENMPALSPADCFMELSLFFEDRIGKVKVLNPQLFPDRDSVLHVFEVQQSLGLLGTLQELYIKPVALLPRQPDRDRPTMSSKVQGLDKPFSPSVRHHGLLTISAKALQASDQYEVVCEDERDEILSSLNKEEMSLIKETYQHLELSGIAEERDRRSEGGPSGIDIEKYEDIMHRRVAEYSDLIEEQYQSYIEEHGLASGVHNRGQLSHHTEEEMNLIGLKKQQYLQSLQEMYMKCILLLQASNVFKSNAITFTEFILIEAWWLRCAIHPQRAHLF